MGSQLQMSVQPTFSDLADSALAANNPLNDTAIRAVSRNAKFGAVRCESIYAGFFKHGDTVPPPISPVDFYAYSAAEILFDYEVFCSRAAGVGFVSGQKNPPPIAFSQSGNPFWFTYDIDSSRIVQLNIAYADGTSAVHDGIVKVNAVGQRNAALAISAIPTYLDVPDGMLAVGQPLRVGNAGGAFGVTDISHNAKFGAVRCEIIYLGFWAMGYTIAPPASPVDGYVYNRTECIFRGVPYSNLAPAGAFTNGPTDPVPPTLANGRLARDAIGKGPLYWWVFGLDAMGNTSSAISYFVQGGAETIKKNSGIFKVFAICQRGSQNA